MPRQPRPSEIARKKANAARKTTRPVAKKPTAKRPAPKAVPKPLEPLPIKRNDTYMVFGCRQVSIDPQGSYDPITQVSVPGIVVKDEDGEVENVERLDRFMLGLKELAKDAGVSL